MPRAPLPANENERLRALWACDLLDTTPEREFDDLTSLAAQLCATPMASVSLIDRKRQWFKSRVGMGSSETGRDRAICAHTILGEDPLIIRDATLDERTRDNPLVIGEPGIRFYAGIPLRDADGFALGTLCVIDTKARDLSLEQLTSLKHLARQVMQQIELRRQLRKSERMQAAIDGTRFGVGRAAAAIFLLGLLVTGWAVFRSHRASQALATQRFERLNERVVDDISRRVNLPTYGMKGARGVYAASKSVNREAFSAYVASRDLAREFPGILGFGFVQPVKRGELVGFLAGERADGVADFNMHAYPGVESEGEQLYVIKYMYPEEANRHSWGYDMGSEPVRRAAVEHAMLTGETTLTAPITLLQDAGKRPGLLYFVPVYKNGSAGVKAAHGPGLIAGLVFAPMIIDDILSTTSAAADGMLNVEVVDGGERVFATKVTKDEEGTGAFRTTSALQIGGRTWQVQMRSNARFEAGIDKASQISTGITGTLLSLLLATVAWSMGRSRSRAFAMASSMTADLNEAKNRAEKSSRELQAQSASLQVQTERLELALGSGGLGTWDWNPRTGDANFDSQWAAIVGKAPRTEHINEWFTRIHLDDLGAVQTCLSEHLLGNTPLFESVHRLRGANGEWLWNRTKAVVVSRDESRRPTRVVGICQDITREKQAEEAINAAASMLRRTGELAHVGGWEYELSTGKVTWSEEVYRIHELPIGWPITATEGIAYYPAGAREQIESAISHAVTTGTGWDLELPLITAKGRQIWVRAQGECVKEEGVVVKLCGAFQDITDRKTAEELLRRSATHDKLTGLPNRALLNDRLQQCLSRYERHPERPFAVLFMDFDRFKLTNDTLGHEAGDELLKQIASRLRRCLRPTDSVGMKDDYSTVGRLGGDEFVVIVDEMAGADDAIIVANRLLAALAAPYQIMGHEVVSTASIGIVTSSSEYTKAEDMLRDADIAMYEAKLAGKGRYVVFDTKMHERVQKRMRIEADLRKAMAGDQFFMEYQPIVTLGGGETRGVEALLRWNHPAHGRVGPTEFISIAEETGLMLPLGERILRMACMQFREWQRTLGEQAPKWVSVNLSRKQLLNRMLPAQLLGVLNECGMLASNLHLEVTEHAIMKDPVLATQILKEIRAVGVRVNMSEFGTGHSSLSMLHKFPIDGLKVDRSFVRNLSGGRAYAAIVEAITQLAHNLGLTVVAEGIETSNQLVTLQAMGCEMGQGYLLSVPLSADAVSYFVRRAIDWTAMQSGV